jgi:hypothetical protein
MCRACRMAGLRIRTGLANADDRIAWNHHVDHVATEAAERAARRAVEATYNDDQSRALFHEPASRPSGGGGNPGVLNQFVRRHLVRKPIARPNRRPSPYHR